LPAFELVFNTELKYYERRVGLPSFFAHQILQLDALQHIRRKMSSGDNNMHRSERDGRNGRDFQSGQRYSNIEAHGMGRIQNGNNTYYITYNLFGDTDDRILLPTDGELRGILPASIERLPMEESQGTSRTVRQDRRQQSMDVAMASLERHAICARELKTGKDRANIWAHLAVILDTLARSGHGNGPPNEVDDQIQNLCKQIEQSRSIKINTPCPRQQVAQSSRAETKILSVHAGSWQITLSMKTVKSGCVDGESGIQTCSALHVQHLRSGGGTHLTALFSEKSSIEGYASLPPVLFPYRQVRNTDRIFQLVANDDLRSLYKLLRAREICLRDCDEDGRSLLFVSTNSRLSPEVGAC
jgi:hypothetical protein